MERINGFFYNARVKSFAIFYGISTFFGYLVPNLLWIYICIKSLSFRVDDFYGISNIVGYLMANPLYTYILNIYNLVWLGFMPYQPL